MNTFKKAFCTSIAFASLAFGGMISAGLLFSVATNPSPAEAGSQRRVVGFGTEPVSQEAIDAITKTRNDFLACIVRTTGGGQSRREGDLLEFDTSFNSAIQASQLAQGSVFAAERTKFNTVLGRLKVTFPGC